jgi:hypothetical protein
MSDECWVLGAGCWVLGNGKSIREALVECVGAG